MTKETTPATTKGLLGITTAGAAEGALIGSFFPGTPATTLVGGVVGGATGFSLEVGRRLISNNKKEALEVIPSTNSPVDVMVETTSTTSRVDEQDTDTQPIVKTKTVQATGVSQVDLPSTMASLRTDALVDTIPTWQTTLTQKTTATATDTAVYALQPQRIG
ncbi:hypothetical protein KBC80_03665 [Candidatus Woesebacteria bacterium]|nr:hypothetical protein [Candidatus Woesebacteria bacterium]